MAFSSPKFGPVAEDNPCCNYPLDSLMTIYRNDNNAIFCAISSLLNDKFHTFSITRIAAHLMPRLSPIALAMK